MELDQLVQVWLHGKSRPVDWPSQGLAIEGDFAGIQKFVLKPVPGAKGAAKRLRGRSLRVAALADLIANEVTAHFDSARIFYQAGGRILLYASRTPDWEARLLSLQERLDRFFLSEFNGETVFHLAASPFLDGKIPVQKLVEAMGRRRTAPLSKVLKNAAGRWNSTEFYEPAPEQDAFRCPACLNTAGDGVPQPDDNNQVICQACVSDQQLGAQLASVKAPCLETDPQGPLEFLANKYRISSKGRPLDLIHRLPRDRQGNPLSLTEVAACALGSRQYLGYLRLDADSVGEKFKSLAGDPALTLTLSELLQQFFCGQVQKLLEDPRCSNIYPVYGGGDDVFVIGPWNEAIQFAYWLGRRLHDLVGAKITFSAAMALAKPGQHILTKADEAEYALTNFAKKEKPAFHALGTTIPWSSLPHVLQTAQKLSDHVNRQLVPVSLLRDLIGLHNQSLHQPDSVRHRPLLHYQIQRNLKVKGDDAMQVRAWASRLATAEWRWAGFLARYALLARQDVEGQRKDGADRGE